MRLWLIATLLLMIAYVVAEKPTAKSNRETESVIQNHRSGHKEVRPSRDKTENKFKEKALNAKEKRYSKGTTTRPVDSNDSSENQQHNMEVKTAGVKSAKEKSHKLGKNSKRVTKSQTEKQNTNKKTESKSKRNKRFIPAESSEIDIEIPIIDIELDNIGIDTCNHDTTQTDETGCNGSSKPVEDNRSEEVIRSKKNKKNRNIDLSGYSRDRTEPMSESLKQAEELLGNPRDLIHLKNEHAKAKSASHCSTIKETISKQNAKCHMPEQDKVAEQLVRSIQPACVQGNTDSNKQFKSRSVADKNKEIDHNDETCYEDVSIRPQYNREEIILADNECMKTSEAAETPTDAFFP